MLTFECYFLQLVHGDSKCLPLFVLLLLNLGPQHQCRLLLVHLKLKNTNIIYSTSTSTGFYGIENRTGENGFILIIQKTQQNSRIQLIVFMQILFKIS